MAIVEGEPFHCNIHGFTTESLDEWNNHCFGNPEHTEKGKVACKNCGKIVVYSGLPWHKIDKYGSKNISLLCDSCQSQTVGNVTTTQ